MIFTESSELELGLERVAKENTLLNCALFFIYLIELCI